jgi:hypothetical protein
MLAVSANLKIGLGSHGRLVSLPLLDVLVGVLFCHRPALIGGNARRELKRTK